MRITGLLIAALLSAGSPSLAQNVRRAPLPQEECPQGRQIRAQKPYPPTMTDCEVLDADTASENQKLQRKPTKAAIAQQPTKPQAPKPGATATVQPVPELVPSPAQTVAPPTPQQSPPPPTTVTAVPLRGDYDGRMIGNWMTSAKEDRFGDGGTFVAIVADGSVVLAVRCIQKTLSLGIGEIGFDQKPIAKGDLFLLKFRVDALPVVETVGSAISERLIQIETERALVKSIRDGKETAVRVSDTRGTTITHIFKTAGSRSAFADLSRECPLE
jgi:hypothetical protein